MEDSKAARFRKIHIHCERQIQLCKYNELANIRQEKPR